MSSFNVHRTHVLNNDEPIEHRYSHLRSCLNKVANLLLCTRSQLINQVISETGINVEDSRNPEELIIAFNYLLNLRSNHLKMQYAQYSVVKLKRIYSEFNDSELQFDQRTPRVGDIATIIEIYQSPCLGYELECCNKNGITEWLIAFSADEVVLELLS